MSEKQIKEYKIYKSQIRQSGATKRRKTRKGVRCLWIDIGCHWEKKDNGIREDENKRDEKRREKVE